MLGKFLTLQIKSPESGKLATNRVSPSTTTVLNTAVPIVKTKSKKSRRNKKEKQVRVQTFLVKRNLCNFFGRGTAFKKFILH